MAQPKKQLRWLNAKAISQCKIWAIMFQLKTFLSNSLRSINLNLAAVTHKEKLLFLIAADAAFTAEMLWHACCHVTLAGGTTLINTHTLAGFFIDIRAPQTTLNNAGCWPGGTPPAFLFFSSNAGLRPTQSIRRPKRTMPALFRPLIRLSRRQHRRPWHRPQQKRGHKQKQKHVNFHKILPRSIS